MRVLSNLASVPLAGLPDALRPAESEIEPGHSSTGQLDLLWDDPEAAKWRSETEGVFIPPVKVAAIPNIEIRSDNLPYQDGEMIFVPGVHPKYVQIYYEKGALGLATDATPIRYVEAPTFFVTSFVTSIYGHFLLEGLPKILLAMALRERGVNARVAFPSDAGAVTQIVRSICPEDSLLLYESAKERLRLRLSLHPSLMASGQLHKLFVELLRPLIASIVSRQSSEPTLSKRLFLSRAKWPSGYRSLANEAELFEIAAEYGFCLVHPQEHAWSDQVRMLARATHVVGGFNSALHGTLFCSSGTRTIALGRVNNLQDCIAASLGHRIGYVRPSKGAVSQYDPVLKPPPQVYEVDGSEFRTRLAAVS